MKYLRGSVLFTLLVVWTVLTLMGVDPVEAGKTSGSALQRGQYWYSVQESHEGMVLVFHYHFDKSKSLVK